jgi:alkylhydroperoxidase/carboxymuconolactone decarboxylase family protein YurZ
LQCGVYCGAPSAVESFKIAQEVFKEMDAEKKAG